MASASAAVKNSGTSKKIGGKITHLPQKLLARSGRPRGGVPLREGDHSAAGRLPELGDRWAGGRGGQGSGTGVGNWLNN